MRLPWFVAALLCAPAPAQPPGAPPPTAVVRAGVLKQELERPGVFQPVPAALVEFAPARFQGEGLFVHVLAHGTLVQKGETIARLEKRALHEQIEELEAEQAGLALRLESARQQGLLAVEAENLQLRQAEAGLARAVRSISGREQYELPLARRAAELQELGLQHGIDDQRDELAQLEAMYRADELVDATEELVLQRARRNLARSQSGMTLQQERRVFQETYAQAMEGEARKEALEAQTQALQHLKIRQALAAAERQEEQRKLERATRKHRARLEELMADLRLMELRAPAAGLLLHGGPEHYRPGSQPPRHRPGSRAGARTVLFTVAEPDRFCVALALPEPLLGKVRPGMAARVLPAVEPARPLLGTLRLEAFPDPASHAGPENLFPGLVELSQPAVGLKAGMRARVLLALEAPREALLVPAAALFGPEGARVCYAERDGVFEPVPVQAGPVENGQVAVSGALVDGQKVLLCEPKRD